jgi:hypothetical protein
MKREKNSIQAPAVIKVPSKKMKNINKKAKDNQKKCGVCEAGFEIWLNNSNLAEERKEKISKHLLSYCPICAKIGSR